MSVNWEDVNEPDVDRAVLWCAKPGLEIRLVHYRDGSYGLEMGENDNDPTSLVRINPKDIGDVRSAINALGSEAFRVDI